MSTATLTATGAYRPKDGSVWMWGSGSGGQLGDNTVTTKSSPVSVVGNHSFVKISLAKPNGGTHVSFALKSDGSVWSWGLGTSGALGDNTATTKSSPVSVVGNHSFTEVYATASGAYGLKSDGSVWSWGLGTSGQLGDNTVTTKSSPVSVVGNHSFTTLASGITNVYALKSDGSVWS